MKRSEMIKLITDKLFYGKLAEKARLSGAMITDLAEKDAEAILKRLESVGMLPPESTVEKIINCGDGQKLETSTGNIWEDEQE